MEDKPKKSHYFVATPPKSKKKYCHYCGKEFESNRSRKKYCSYECYKEALKDTKRLWYNKNKERLLKKQNEYNRVNRDPKVRWEKLEEPDRLNVVRKSVRDFFLLDRAYYIKQGLINLELMDFQIPYRKIKVNMVGNRASHDHDLLDDIKDKLRDHSLYPDQFYSRDDLDLEHDNYDHLDAVKYRELCRHFTEIFKHMKT